MSFLHIAIERISNHFAVKEHELESHTHFLFCFLFFGVEKTTMESQEEKEEQIMLVEHTRLVQNL